MQGTESAGRTFRVIPDKCNSCKFMEEISGAHFCMKTAAVIEDKVPDSCPIKEKKNGYEDLQQLHPVQGEV